MSPGTRVLVEDDPADEAEAPERASTTRPSRSRRQRVVLGAGVAAVLFCVIAVAAVGYGWYRYSQIDRQHLDLTAAQGAVQNYLIVGSDSRSVVDKSAPDAKAFLDGNPEGGGQRSDTIMVARIDPKTGTIDLLSFPRDLWIPIPGTDGRERINTAFSLGGAQRLIDTIQSDFGIPINHYVEIDFKSFKGIVRAVDGVPMYFDKALRDTNSGLYIDQPGCAKLDGEQALAFSRARHLQYQDDKGRWHDDPTGDLGRITRQQTFIRRVIDRAQTRIRGLDLRASNELIGAAVDNLSVDSSFDIGGLVALARSFKDFTGDQVHTWPLPVTPDTTAGGAAVLRLDEDGAQDVLNVFRGLPQGVFPASDVHLSLVNSGAGDDKVQRARDALATVGFSIDGAPTSAKGTTATTIRYATGSKRAAEEVARYLPSSVKLAEDPTLSGGTVVLVLGRDFTTVRQDAAPLDSTTDTTQVRSGQTTRRGAASSSTKAPSTTTTTQNPTSEPVGVTPGDPPEGVSCG